MQLRFLGQTYSTSSDRVKTDVSENTARFLGQSYTLRVPTQIFKYPLGASVRKYRGVSYIIETKARIAKKLLRICSRPLPIKSQSKV